MATANAVGNGDGRGAAISLEPEPSRPAKRARTRLFVPRRQFQLPSGHIWCFTRSAEMPEQMAPRLF